jgi:hypothetical protein
MNARRHPFVLATAEPSQRCRYHCVAVTRWQHSHLDSVLRLAGHLATALDIDSRNLCHDSTSAVDAEGATRPSRRGGGRAGVGNRHQRKPASAGLPCTPTIKSAGMTQRAQKKRHRRRCAFSVQVPTPGPRIGGDRSTMRLAGAGVKSTRVIYVGSKLGYSGRNEGEKHFCYPQGCLRPSHGIGNMEQPKKASTKFFNMTREHRPRLFDKAYWDRPEFDPEKPGDNRAEEIFQAVGESLSMWEGAECQLAAMYMMLCDVKTPASMGAVNRAFGSIESSAGRRKALLAAAEMYFGSDWDAASKYFLALLEAFSSASSRRDEFAHGMAHGITINNVFKGVFLFPAQYNTQRTHAHFTMSSNDIRAVVRAKYCYTSDQIRSISARFGELMHEVTEYFFQLRKVNGRPVLIWDGEQGAGAAKRIEQLLLQSSVAG